MERTSLQQPPAPRCPAWHVRPGDDVQDMPGRYQVEAGSVLHTEEVTGPDLPGAYVAQAPVPDFEPKSGTCDCQQVFESYGCGTLRSFKRSWIDSSTGLPSESSVSATKCSKCVTKPGDIPATQTRRLYILSFWTNGSSTRHDLPIRFAEKSTTRSSGTSSYATRTPKYSKKYATAYALSRQSAGSDWKPSSGTIEGVSSHTLRR